MNSNENECKGTLRISQDVLSEIAAAAACEIDGTVCKKSDISVKYCGGASEISIALSLKPGVRAAACAEAVQESVRDSVQNMTGITVSRVNIKICGQV